MERWHGRDLEVRAELLVKAIEQPISEIIANAKNPKDWILARRKVHEYLEPIVQDERLSAVMICSGDRQPILVTTQKIDGISCPPLPPVIPEHTRETVGKNFFQVTRVPLAQIGGESYSVVVVHDLRFAAVRSSSVQKYLIVLFIALGLIVCGITVLIARLTYRSWYNFVSGIIRGDADTPRSHEALQLKREVNHLLRELDRTRALKEEGTQNWSPETLRAILKSELAGDEVLIVSNREPYIHNRNKDGEIEVQVPASGLVTALEPVMRACSGTWIAHGSGSADKEAVDSNDRVRVPPDAPAYQIRRIWLSEEEEKGYYFGFANEGLWPLCHIAHTRPIFRSEDFEHYRKVNERFADTVAQESKTDNPVVLVQDYHFGLLPKMIRKRLPKATIITFWHIPWPNAESFSVCPWKEEILEGLLGSSILGFHTRFHCNNFLEAVDRFLEARIQRDDSRVTFDGHLTAIRSYPISIEWPIRWAKTQTPIEKARRTVRERHGFSPEIKLGIGVDRMDYTKGILERLAAVERLFELHPEWIGKMAFIQIAAPTRSSIPHYRHFAEELHTIVERINQRFGKNGYTPVVLLDRHHSPEQVFEYFRASEFCFVSSLHDGMNLVAKEFIAARDDDRGVLVLSQFTGAARELPESLIVNPYDSDQCAHAIHQALIMPEDQQEARMRNMRIFIQEYNVFRWAGRMLLDAARIRQRSVVLGDAAEAQR